jgi:archaellum component FlaF (FlaF/FlaG flagellin family)
LDKTIVTALLVIAGVISAVFVFNSIYPAVVQSSDAMTSMERRIDERLKSQVEIVHAAKSGTQVLIWAKNVGSLRILGVESCDVFFGPEGAFSRIPYGVGTPHWEYVVENGTEWMPTATAKITIVDYSPLSSGRYFIKLVLSNGVSDEDYISW